MKKLFLYMVFALLTIGAWAQSPVLKLYACSQETMPGIRPVSPDDGKEVTSPLPVTYYLYAKVRKGTRLTTLQVYIKGVPYSALLQKVQSPVLVVTDAVMIPNKKAVLVNKTMHDVYRIIPGESSTKAQDKAGQQMAGKNEVVLVVMQAGKKQYATVRNIQQLPQLAGT